MTRAETKTSGRRKVFVAMSGGVDSSVAAGLMQEAGHEVVGVTMCFSISHPGGKRPSCCGVDGIADARRAAQILGLPHYVLDFAADINEHIIEDFTREYLNGRTPNPCVRCNQHLKFGSLYQKVMTMGADCLATGHYAKIEFNSQEGCYEMKKAVDAQKDQSYFLYHMKQDTLSRVLFPLGYLTKEEVRAVARKYRLNTADKPESQDICFIPDGGYKRFIRDRVGEKAFVPGPFKNHRGEVVGEHRGIANFTIGQRDKLGIALGYPAYVFKIDRADNTVYVGPSSELYAKGFVAGAFNPLSRERPLGPVSVQARIRYNSPAVCAILTPLDDGRVEVNFVEPQKSVTPGQSAVFYQNEVVLGGAVIETPIRCEAREAEAFYRKGS
jgi:tRNA-specific 2-thiouridylase